MIEQLDWDHASYLLRQETVVSSYSLPTHLALMENQVDKLGPIEHRNMQFHHTRIVNKRRVRQTFTVTLVEEPL
jgi:hypothetical protein